MWIYTHKSKCFLSLLYNSVEFYSVLRDKWKKRNEAIEERVGPQMASGHKPTTAEVKRWAWQLQQADIVVATSACCWSGLGAARFLAAFWWRVFLILCFPSVKRDPTTQTSKLNITNYSHFISGPFWEEQRQFCLCDEQARTTRAAVLEWRAE